MIWTRNTVPWIYDFSIRLLRNRHLPRKSTVELIFLVEGSELGFLEKIEKPIDWGGREHLQFRKVKKTGTFERKRKDWDLVAIWFDFFKLCVISISHNSLELQYFFDGNLIWFFLLFILNKILIGWISLFNNPGNSTIILARDY